jgi:hypothetical protein
VGSAAPIGTFSLFGHAIAVKACAFGAPLQFGLLLFGKSTGARPADQ